MPHRHIHRILKKHSPRAVHKAKKLVAFKYPKFIFLIIIIALAYYLFTLDSVKSLISNLGNFSYATHFLAGVLFSFGFTTAFSIGFLLNANPSDILLVSIIAGVGSVIGDMLIFRTIKISFMDEFRQLEKTRAIKKIEKIVKKNKHVLISHYLLYIFAGIVLVTPLPDEIGVAMLAGLTTINQKIFVVISFLLHTIGFYALLYLIV